MDQMPLNLRLLALRKVGFFELETSTIMHPLKGQPQLAIEAQVLVDQTTDAARDSKGPKDGKGVGPD